MHCCDLLYSLRWNGKITSHRRYCYSRDRNCIWGSKHGLFKGQSWSWSYGTWIDNHLCNQCRSPLTLWVRIPPMRGVHGTTLCELVCQWLAAGGWFSPGSLVSSINKTDCHDIIEILLSGVTHYNPNSNPNPRWLRLKVKTLPLLTLVTKLIFMKHIYYPGGSIWLKIKLAHIDRKYEDVWFQMLCVSNIYTW